MQLFRNIAALGRLKYELHERHALATRDGPLDAWPEIDKRVGIHDVRVGGALPLRGFRFRFPRGTRRA
jgi:hypothetical protein